MKVIGIKGSGPTTAAALVVDKHLTAVAEERLTGQRYCDDFPVRAVKYLLTAAGIDDINAVDRIVFSDLRRGEQAPMEETIRARLAYNGTINFLGNHDAHAAAAFFTSPFDDGAVLVADRAGNLCRHTSPDAPHYLRDGDGMRELQRTYRGLTNRLLPIQTTASTPTHRHGILDMCASVVRFLNFKPHALGTLTDLAAAGGRKPLGFAPFFSTTDGDIVVQSGRDLTDDPSALSRAYLNDLRPRQHQPLPDDIYTEIAYKAQTETINAVVIMAQRLQQITRCRNLCVGGQIAANGQAMATIAEKAGFENLFVFPTGEGVSVAVGCAIWGAKILGEPRLRFELRSGCLGPVADDEMIRATIDSNAHLKRTKPTLLMRDGAKLLADGLILGWVRGGSEAGPQGLGHRSVLCDARDGQAMARLRKALRRSDAFRPYGVAILEEFSRSYFDLPSASPWMGLSARVKADKAEQMVNGLAGYGPVPIQTVSRRNDPDLFRLLDEYYRLTGVPLLLHAPLRASGNPLAETPADAIACFMNTGLHRLIAGPYLVDATDRKVAVPERPKPIARRKGVRTRIKEALGFR